MTLLYSLLSSIFRSKEKSIPIITNATTIEFGKQKRGKILNIHTICILKQPIDPYIRSIVIPFYDTKIFSLMYPIYLNIFFIFLFLFTRSIAQTPPSYHTNITITKPNKNQNKKKRRMRKPSKLYLRSLKINSKFNIIPVFDKRKKGRNAVCRCVGVRIVFACMWKIYNG